MPTITTWRLFSIKCPAPGCNTTLALTFEEFLGHFTEDHSLDLTTVRDWPQGYTNLPMSGGEEGEGEPRPWDCRLCGAKFETAAKLWTHLTTYHGCS